MFHYSFWHLTFAARIGGEMSGDSKTDEGWRKGLTPVQQMFGRKKINLMWHKLRFGYYELKNLNRLGDVKMHGVYMIWCDYRDRREDGEQLVIGKGDVGEALLRYQSDPDIRRYQTRGPVYVTWAEVAECDQDGVMRSLANRHGEPVLGEPVPDVEPISAIDESGDLTARLWPQ